MRRTMIVLGIVAALTVTTALAAAAAHRPWDADQEDVVVEWSYDAETSQLTWWLAPVLGDEDPVECPEVDVADDGCHVVDIGTHDGEANHGMFVSAFVHSLKELDLGVPRGWLVRQVAQSDLGKGGEDGGDPEVEELELDAGDRHGKPDHAGKKDHGGRPDHAGKPAHAGPKH